jgi:hypothetical protein
MRAQQALRESGPMASVASLTLFRYNRWVDRHWALWQMLLARRPLNRLPGVRFMKMVGTGSREGFYLAPNTAVWGLLAAWPSLEHAQAQVNGARRLSALFPPRRRGDDALSHRDARQGRVVGQACPSRSTPARPAGR